jgi:Ca2+-binding EF-hand superfamily protein
VYNNNGCIYYNDFCVIVATHFRGDGEEHFQQELFRTMAGAKQVASDDVPAGKYDIAEEFITREQFIRIMTNLPEAVEESEVEAMFSAVDVGKTDKISFGQFSKEQIAAADEVHFFFTRLTSRVATCQVSIYY